MVNVGMFYDHLEYFMAIWYNLWPLGIVCGHLLYFPRLGMFGPRKIWQPLLRDRCYGHIFLQFLSIFGKKLAFFS
jgi:hypothetical protein